MKTMRVLLHPALLLILCIGVYHCSKDSVSPEPDETTKKTYQPSLPHLSAPILLDSSTSIALDSGDTVDAVVNGKTMQIALIKPSVDTGTIVEADVLLLETGADTIFYFKKMLGSASKKLLKALAETDSILGTWRAFQVEYDGIKYQIPDDNSNNVELTIQTSSAESGGIQMTMAVTGTPFLSGNLFEEDSLSLSRKCIFITNHEKRVVLNFGNGAYVRNPSALDDSLKPAPFFTDNFDTMIWRPNNRQTGTYLMTAFKDSIIDLHDNKIYDTLKWTVTVAPNRSPVFESRTQWPDTCIIGQIYTDTFCATDPDNDLVNYWVGTRDTIHATRRVGLIPISCVRDSMTGKYITKFRFNDRDTGTYIMEAWAWDNYSDNDLRDTVKWSITIIDSNHAPKFQDSSYINRCMTEPCSLWSNYVLTMPLCTLFAGIPFIDTLHAKDLDNDPVAFSLMRSITGMTLSDSIISFTPTASQMGEDDTAFIRISDGRGKHDTLAWIVKIRLKIDSLGSCQMPSNTNGMAVSGNYLYYPISGNGLQVVDVNNGSAPFIAGSFAYNGTIADLSLNGNYAYLLAESLVVVNISTPSLPVLAGSWALPSNGRFSYSDRMKISGNYAYISTQNRYSYDVTPARPMTLVLDISIPSAPVKVDSFPVSCTPFGFAIADNNVFMTDWLSGYSNALLRAIDITTPTASIVVDSVQVGHYGPVTVSGNYAFIGNGNLIVVDISTPSFSVVATSSIGVSEISIANNLLFTPDYGKMGVISIQDPNVPKLVGTVASDNYNEGINMVVSGNKAYVATQTNVLEIYQVTTH